MNKFLIGLITFIGLSFTTQSQTLKIGDKAHGGIVAYIDSTGEHGLVCSLEDLGKLKWEEAKKACEIYSFMGNSDWYLPSKFELNLLYMNLHKKGLVGFAANHYWSSTEENNFNAWFQVFSSGNQYYVGKNYGIPNVRAVRAF